MPKGWNEDDSEDRGKQGPKTAFGAALGKKLRSANLSQSALATDLGVSRAYVSSICTGAKTVSPQMVDKIAGALSLSQKDINRLHSSAARDMGFRIDLPEEDDW